MKSTIFYVCILVSLNSVWADIASYSYLGTAPKDHRLKLIAADPKALLANDNISQVIVLPTMQWRLSSAGPSGAICRYKREFLKSIKFEEVPNQISKEVDQLKTFEDYPTPNETIALVSWSDIYFLSKNNDFITFGEDGDWIYFRSHLMLGRFKKASEQGAAANP